MNFSRCAAALTGLVVLLMLNALESDVSGDENGFRLTRVDGTVLESASILVDSQGRVTGTFEGSSLPIDELVSIESVGAESIDSSGNSGAPRLYFVTEGSIALTAPSLAEGRLTFQSTNHVSTVPLESARAIVWEPSDVVTQLIENPSLDNDAVVVRQGDQLRGVEGVVEGLTDQHVTLRFKGESRKIGLGKVAAIVMADLQLKLPEDRPMVNVMLRSGGSVQGSLNRWNENLMFVGVGGDIELEVPAGSMAKMTIESERLVYLSDLEPVSAQQRAMFTNERPWRRDRSVEGNPLTLFNPAQRQKVRFDKGVGTHSWSSLVFANDRSLDRFMAVVGIDAETNGRGKCLMVVRGDGIELWSGQVTGMSEPQSIDVDIRGIQTVELEVVPGEEFDLADHANWCNARFVKSSP